eukprot:Skav214818  [mRNA]  locus=scaffold1934:170511:189491:- [translate_table: standard]
MHSGCVGIAQFLHKATVDMGSMIGLGGKLVFYLALAVNHCSPEPERDAICLVGVSAIAAGMSTTSAGGAGTFATCEMGKKRQRRERPHSRGIESAEPLRARSPVAGEAMTLEDNARACQARCFRRNPSCAFFSYWNPGGQCHLLGFLTMPFVDSRPTTPGWISAPPSCDVELRRNNSAARAKMAQRYEDAGTWDTTLSFLLHFLALRVPQVLECQLWCEEQHGCHFFSYFALTGLCHLSPAYAERLHPVSMGVQLAYNVVRHTPVTTYAEIAILFPQLLLLTLVVAWADGILGPRIWPGSTGVNLCLCMGVMAMALGWVAGLVLNWTLVSTLMLQFAVYRDRRPLPAKPASLGADIRRGR